MCASSFEYPEGMDKKGRVKWRKEILKKRQDELFYDTYENGRSCNLIFSTKFKDQWKAAIEAAYPGTTRNPLKNGDVQLILNGNCYVNVFRKKIMIQGDDCTTFEQKFAGLKDNVLLPRRMDNMRINSHAESN